MYGLLIDGIEIVSPPMIFDEIKIWEGIVRNTAAIASPGSLVDAYLLDWLTANLPQTNPPVNTRPGAEYGVDV